MSGAPAIEAICIGLPKPFNGAELSAIDKKPVEGSVTIRKFGIEGDMVADTKVHGGPDKAVHLYPHEHYAFWREELGGHALLEGPAAFGENLMCYGLKEDAVLIGDRFRIGTAILEVSQPRQPCWKIDHRFQHKGMVKRIIQTHRSGYYFRVLEEGRVQAGDLAERVAPGHTGWTVARVFSKLYDPSDLAAPHELDEIAGLERLSAVFREKALKARAAPPSQ